MAHDTCLLVAAVKDEGPGILEWIAHHRLCGFDRIQIHQSGSSDTTVQSLRILDRLGVIELHETEQGGKTRRVAAYRHAGESHAWADSDWCMVLGADQFLNVKTGAGRVRDLIDACPDGMDAILVNRRIFGSNAHTNLGNGLVTARFTQAEPTMGIADRGTARVRPLFRTTAFGRPGGHLPLDPKGDSTRYCSGSAPADGEDAHQKGPIHDPIRGSIAEVHHHALRDMGSFLLRVAERRPGALTQSVASRYWQSHDRNDDTVTDLADRASKTLAEMQRLDDLSGGKLMRLRRRAIRHWRLTLETVLERDDIAALRDTLLAEAPASDDRPDSPDTIGATPFHLPGAHRSTPVFSSSRTAFDEVPARARAGLG